MPELPDIHAFADYLESTALHKTIAHTHVDETVLKHGTTVQAVAGAATGNAMEQTRTHGKLLFARVEKKWLVFHFGMTGHFGYARTPQDPDHTHADFELENGFHFSYIAPRKLGFVDLTDDVDAYVNEKKLGEDALRVSADRFVELMQNRRGGVKSALMDQSLIAGVGNVYADEILFQAGIHPKSQVKSIDKDTLRTLHGVMQRVLKEAAKRQADPSQFPDSWLIPHREEGAACPKCTGKVQRIEVNGRGTFVCHICQNKIP